jgi:peptide chain release factor 2
MLELNDNSLKTDLESQYSELESQFIKLKKDLRFNGKYDDHDAVITLTAGAGGTDAQDWTAMLLRMYTRWAEQQNFDVQLLEESVGEEAGLKRAMLEVSGPFAYGRLASENGVHRLVRLSPFNADSLRQTSFSGVEVMPLVEDDSKVIELKPEELDWQFSRAGGHGGQNVNKVNTAVQLTHIPSGIVVESRQERHQEQNRKIALTLLKSKLAEAEEQKLQEEMARVKGTHKIAGWGNQIRNYVLHPYHLVKDVRTQVETSDTEAVLDGDLDIFIEAECKLS